jgi:hypothetical protein
MNWTMQAKASELGPRYHADERRNSQRRRRKGLLFTQAFIGWSAYVSAAANILGFVTLIAFFAVGEPFGVINDLTTVILALSMVPLAFVLHKLHERTDPRLSFGAFVGGVLAMVGAAALQALLVLRVVRFELTLVAVPVAFGVIGVWLVLNSYLGRSSGTLPKGLIWVGIVAGGGYVLAIMGFLLSGQQHPLAAAGGLTAVICYPVWAVWFGRLLVSGRVPA